MLGRKAPKTMNPKHSEYCLEHGPKWCMTQIQEAIWFIYHTSNQDVVAYASWSSPVMSVTSLNNMGHHACFGKEFLLSAAVDPGK